MATSTFSTCELLKEINNIPVKPTQKPIQGNAYYNLDKPQCQVFNHFIVSNL